LAHDGVLHYRNSNFLGYPSGALMSRTDPSSPSPSGVRNNKEISMSDVEVPVSAPSDALRDVSGLPLVDRLEAAARDERLSTGALYLEAAEALSGATQPASTVGDAERERLAQMCMARASDFDLHARHAPTLNTVPRDTTRHIMTRQELQSVAADWRTIAQLLRTPSSSPGDAV
jgi:hypothetical protein